MILRRHCKKRAQTGRSMIMGMATSKVRLNICGSSYVVNTSESEDYMQNLADRLNLDMNELMASSSLCLDHDGGGHDGPQLPR